MNKKIINAFLMLVFTMPNICNSMQSDQNENIIDETSYFNLVKKQIDEMQEFESMDITWFLNDRRHNQEKIFSTLDIQLPKDKIIEYFNKYEVIVNRLPQHDILIVGCGNVPSYQENIYAYMIDDFGEEAPIYRSNHSHPEADTIDPDYARNPTIIAYFANQPLTDLFKDEFDYQHRYKEIKFEGYFPLQITYDQEYKDAHADEFEFLLQKDGIVTLEDDVLYTQGKGWNEDFLEKLKP